MKSSVADYVTACHNYQRNKSESLSPAGLLQPLQAPSQVWADIFMDFIDGLPPSSGKSVIFVVVDRFSKYGHFLTLAHPYTATHVAQLFMDHIVRLHGVPASITNDKDVVFTSTFWKELFKLQGTKDPPRLLSYEPGSSKVAALDQALAERDAMLCQLPSDAKLHDVFHVSQSKAFTGDSPLLHTPLPPLQEGCVLSTPAQVLQARRVQGNWEILVQWADTTPLDSTWEPLASFKALYPTFDLEDKLFLQEGGDVMDSIASRVTGRHRS
ncbi:uncharacterized protein [Aristolochia californica]|uniref:uncharacterized protein n=1 Tax=Aristolochia californica TaxID=171875 RepID=UPI0035DB5BBE